jgi:enamine deaminase RidA (YjgF/YER057c/UK114 family)
LSVEDNLFKKYGLTLPEAAAPKGLYTPTVQTGNLIYVSGQTPKRDGKLLFKGKLGKDLTVEQGQQAAIQATINGLSLLKTHVGDLCRVKKFVQLLGFVRSAEDFGDQPQVMNAASQLILDLFGDRGAHTRLALGTSELPNGAAIEVTFIVEIE